MSAHNRSLGIQGENAAARRLSELGYEILARNVRTPFGELDLVARQAEMTVFIEVKTRRSRSHGLPEESITPRKRTHLISSAQHYLQAVDRSAAAWRIDLVAVDVDSAGAIRRIEVFENAVHD
jgi:putative endonuclease